MNKVIATFALLLAPCFWLNAGEITIEQCVEKAVGNYPLVKKYDLLAKTCDVALSDINKGWLPAINASGQVTVQNAVPAFPDMLSEMLKQMGQSFDGLGKVQYKVGIDVSQNIWDGGVSRARRNLQRNETASQNSRLDVEMYAIRQRVENLYFAILLAEEQIKQNNNAVSLINANINRLRAMLKNGTAMQSDVDMLQAQALMIEQNISLAESAVKGYRKVLEIFIGEDLNDSGLVMPGASVPATMESDRPELKFYNSRLALIEASQRLSDTSMMPKVGLFAQTWYGYPGLDNFKSMAERDLSFNILAGVKVSWNIDSFYTKKNNRRRNALEAQSVAADRDVFLFNSSLQTSSATENIAGLRKVITNDGRIMSLRRSVREAAESQLKNGIIDATALLTKINDENQAALTARFHEIQLLQEIYNLKYIINR